MQAVPRYLELARRFNRGQKQDAGFFGSTPEFASAADSSLRCHERVSMSAHHGSSLIQNFSSAFFANRFSGSRITAPKLSARRAQSTSEKQNIIGLRCFGEKFLLESSAADRRCHFFLDISCEASYI
jgi:hypothetical protein